MDIMNLNILLTDYTVRLSTGEAARDIVENYFREIEAEEIFRTKPELIPYKLLNIVKNSAESLIPTFGIDSAKAMVKNYVTEISDVFGYVDIDFTTEYFIFAGNPEVKYANLTDSITKLEAMNNKILNTKDPRTLMSFKQLLLSMYLSKTPYNIVRLKQLSIELKALVTERNSLPVSDVI